MEWVLFRLFSAAFLCCGLLAGSAQQYEGKTISVISFDPVNQPLEASELLATLPMKAHTPLRMADVKASIERLLRYRTLSGH